MDETLIIFFEIYNSFPVAYNWQRYLTMKDWSRLFFSLFIKKYWLNWENTKYNSNDILRRIRMIEFFDFITKNYNTFLDETWRNILETKFYRMVIVETKKKKLDLLSFYNFR